MGQVGSVTAQVRSVTTQADRSPHRLDPRSVTAQARSVTAQARSVTEQADLSPHRLDRSPHRATVNNTVNSIWGEFLIDGITSKAYFKNSKRDFEKRVYALLGHRKIPCTFKVEGPLRLVQRIKELNNDKELITSNTIIIIIIIKIVIIKSQTIPSTAAGRVGWRRTMIKNNDKAS